MHSLLTAVHELERAGIMHRDIKPANFLYDYNSRKGFLIDFGLSELCAIPPKPDGKKFWEGFQQKDTYQKIYQYTKRVGNNRTGTKGYMPLEALFQVPNQNNSVDVWACGVIFLSVLAGRHPIISLNPQGMNKMKDKFTSSNLIMLGSVFGAKAVKEMGFKYGYGVHFPIGFNDKNHLLDIVKWKDTQAVDLLQKLLDLDCASRIKAGAALQHPFFDCVRK